jgi:myosin-5
LYNLKARHVKQLPYTRTGDIVIAVNPYQWFSELYSLSQRLYYGQALVWNPLDVMAMTKTTTTTTTTSNKNKKKEPAHGGMAGDDPRVHLPPHVYEASCLAYKGLLKDNDNQSILVSGESGAGKTETVKILLGDIASVQKGPSAIASPTLGIGDNEIVAKVLDSNPLLEAFGNAQTLRNDNSSRFGKYLQLQFDRESASSCLLAGSKCEVYLLEKSRVTLHHPEERTYHIFYQLLAAPEPTKTQIWSGLSNTDNESFDYVGFSNTNTIEGKTDAERFQLTVRALELIGLHGESLLTLWRAICIVLQLGNLDFVPDPKNVDASVFEDDGDGEGELRALSELMGIASEKLKAALTIRTVQARSETFQIPLTADKAKESTDAFAKEIYAKTFLWLVRTINDATCAEKNYHPYQNNKQKAATTKATSTSTSLADSIRARSSSTTMMMTTTTRTTPPSIISTPSASSARDYGIIGLLDIFGFETFEVNRFEQLCINYANEKLQQKFTQDIFRSVQIEYEMEGIELEEITYDDNTDVLDLVEGRMGLLAFLNEECVRPKGSDKTFVYKAQAMNKDNPCFIRAKHASDHEFGIQHYAGRVTYDATNFVVKNMDTLPTDLQDCATLSSNAIVANELGNEEMMNPMNEGGAIGGGGGATKKRRSKTASKVNSKLMQKRTSNLIAETVWTKFKNQLTHLMETLGETKTRYIRCIKPNSQKKPLLMEHTGTVEQLRCAGVVAAVTISRSAFPNRLEHVIVLERFKSLWPKGDHMSILQDITIEPSQRNSKATEVLLTIALKEMEVQREDGGKTRGFVMGRTRAYFRAGALEFLEGERLRHLGTYAALMQAHVRGFVTRSKYQRFHLATIRLQSGYRRRRARTSYQALRSSVVRVQCFYRILFAARTIVHLRLAFKSTVIQTQWRIRRDQTRYRELRSASIVVQTIVRGALQRPKYRKALQEKKDEAKLENQLASLQRKLEEAEAKRAEVEREAEARAKAHLEQQVRQKEEAELQAKRLEESKKRQEESKQEEEARRIQEEQERKTTEEEQRRSEQEEAEKAADLEREIQMQEEQQRLMDESGRMLEYLRKEVFKLRSQNQQLKTDFDLLKDNNQRLMDANASAGASFAALNQHAKQMSKQNTQIMKEVETSKAQVQKMNIVQVELKDELKMKQASYVAEVQSRLQYQKSLQKVTDMVQEKCRDHRLVEKVLQVADECEMDFLQMEETRLPLGEESEEPDMMDEDALNNQSKSSIFGYLNFFSG